MGRITVTIEWTLFYLFALSLLAALISKASGKNTSRPAWLDGTTFLAFSIGMALIVWHGFHGNLPGTGGSMRAAAPFVARLIAWSGGLGLLAGVAGSLIGSLLVRGSWKTQPQGMGIIVVIPGCIGFLTGMLAGAIVAVVKTFG
jgi:hypothetical protein